MSNDSSEVLRFCLSDFWLSKRFVAWKTSSLFLYKDQFLSSLLY